MDSVPNKPVLTLLVAGHRPDRLPTGEAAVTLITALETLLTTLSATAKAEEATLRVLTGTAGGIDAEAACLAQKLNLPLHLLSPGTPETLSGSHAYAERTVWFGANDPTAHGDAAIAMRDEVALAFADVLLVVWDGEAPHGLSGGTVRLALAAAQTMKPVVWLDTGGAVRLLARTRLNGQALHQLSCPHPEIASLRACFSEPVQGEQLLVSLAATLRLTLDPSPATSTRDKARLEEYQKDGELPEKQVWAGHLHQALVLLLNGNWTRSLGQISAKPPSAWWGNAKDNAGTLIAPTTLLDKRFERFDIEATVAAGRHRDANWLIYFSSALAVFSAVAGAIGLIHGRQSVFWPVAELFVVGIVIGGVLLAKQRRWHERWIGHRFIAEQLRYLRMSLPILGVPAPFKAPAWQVQENGSAAGQLRLVSPETWFLQRSLAQEGVPVGMDGKHFTACSGGALAETVRYVQSVIEQQREYHEKNHHELHVVHTRLHVLTMSLFIATALAVLAHFVIHADWLLIGTAFFPALGSAIHGVSTKLEIARIAGQSAATEERLSHLANAIRSTESHTGWEAWMGLRQMALEASRVMSDENAQWQQLIEHQETKFPA